MNTMVGDEKMEDLTELSIGLPSHIEDYMEDRKWLGTIAISGFSLVINHTPHGSEYFDATYPAEWQNLYVRKRFLWADPIIISTMMFGEGNKRWSGIKVPDVMGVLSTAAKFGLVYGARLSRTNGYKKSMLAVARYDRELLDEEIDKLSEWFDGFLKKIENSMELTDGELAVVKCIARDMTLYEAAEHLNVSYGAVKKRLRQARMKSGCSTDNALVARFIRRL